MPPPTIAPVPRFRYLRGSPRDALHEFGWTLVFGLLGGAATFAGLDAVFRSGNPGLAPMFYLSGFLPVLTALAWVIASHRRRAALRERGDWAILGAFAGALALAPGMYVGIHLARLLIGALFGLPPN